MYRTTFAILATVGLIATIPMAQQSSTAVSSSGREVVPLQMDAGRIKDLQTRLDQQGFSAAEIDGLWGPNTAAALRRFQAAKGLLASGRFDQATLAALDSGGSVTASPAAAAPVTALLIAAAPRVCPSDGDGDSCAREWSRRHSGPDARHERNWHQPRRVQCGRGTATKDGQHVQVWLTTRATSAGNSWLITTGDDDYGQCRDASEVFSISAAAKARPIPSKRYARSRLYDTVNQRLCFR